VPCEMRLAGNRWSAVPRAGATALPGGSAARASSRIRENQDVFSGHGYVRDVAWGWNRCGWGAIALRVMSIAVVPLGSAVRLLVAYGARHLVGSGLGHRSSRNTPGVFPVG